MKSCEVFGDRGQDTGRCHRSGIRVEAWSGTNKEGYHSISQKKEIVEGGFLFGAALSRMSLALMNTGCVSKPTSF